jgi:hypothetical protein
MLVSMCCLFYDAAPFLVIPSLKLFHAFEGIHGREKKESSRGHAFVFVVQHVQYVHPTHWKIFSLNIFTFFVVFFLRKEINKLLR